MLMLQPQQIYQSRANWLVLLTHKEANNSCNSSLKIAQVLSVQNYQSFLGNLVGLWHFSYAHHSWSGAEIYLAHKYEDKHHLVLVPFNLITLRLLLLLSPYHKMHVPVCATLTVTWKTLDLEGSTVFHTVFPQEINQCRTRTNDETSLILLLF